MTKFAQTLNGELTGVVRDYDEKPDPNESKGFDWLPFVEESNPAYDPETHKLGPGVTVIEDGRAVKRRSSEALTEEELEGRRLNKLAATDGALVRAIEDLVVLVAEGRALNRNNLPQAVLDKVNERRALRGEGPV